MRRLNRALLGKLTKLPSSEWLELLRAQAALLHAQVLVWTRARGRLLAPASRSSACDRWSQEPGATAVEPGVYKIALAVERAAEYGLFRPNCLVGAVALQRMVSARGFPGSSVRVGIRWRDGQFMAHAWVDYRGLVLGDRDWLVRKYEQLPDMEVKQPS